MDNCNEAHYSEHGSTGYVVLPTLLYPFPGPGENPADVLPRRINLEIYRACFDAIVDEGLGKQALIPHEPFARLDVQRSRLGKRRTYTPLRPGMIDYAVLRQALESTSDLEEELTIFWDEHSALEFVRKNSPPPEIEPRTRGILRRMPIAVTATDAYRPEFDPL